MLFAQTFDNMYGYDWQERTRTGRILSDYRNEAVPREKTDVSPAGLLRLSVLFGYQYDIQRVLDKTEVLLLK